MVAPINDTTARIYRFPQAQADQQPQAELGDPERVAPATSDEQAPADAASLAPSVALVLNVKSGGNTNAPTVDLAGKISEQDMFAAIAHQELKRINGALADKFASEFPDMLRHMLPQKGANAPFKAADRILRAYLRNKEINQRQYKAIRDEAFGKAQFDTDRSQLGALKADQGARWSISETTVSEALRKYSVNLRASAHEIARFKQIESQVSRAKRRAQREAREASAQTLHAEAARHPSAASAGSPAADAKGPTLLTSEAPSGFIWKPVSASDGKLAVVLPTSWSNLNPALEILDEEGEELIAKGRIAGVLSDGRKIVRFSAAGAEFPENCIVKVTLQDGSFRTVRIHDPQVRNEGRG